MSFFIRFVPLFFLSVPRPLSKCIGFWAWRERRFWRDVACVFVCWRVFGSIPTPHVVCMCWICCSLCLFSFVLFLCSSLVCLALCQNASVFGRGESVVFGVT